MKDIIIIGASGFGKEVAWLIERINDVTPTWNLLGFVDDNPSIAGQTINGYSVLGSCEKLRDFSNIFVICAVGASKVRHRIVERIFQVNPQIHFATLIDPAVKMSNYVTVGEGSIICAGSIITVNITIGCHTIINLDCTVGHDAVLDDFVTLYPSVNISGNTNIGENVEMGTGAQIIQGKNIGRNTIVGAGSVVIKDLPQNCTAVGAPAKPIKYFDE